MNTVSPIKVFFAFPFVIKIILLIFFISTLGIGWGFFWLYLLLFGLEEDAYKKIKIQTSSKEQQNNYYKYEAYDYNEIKDFAYERQKEDEFFIKKNERFNLNEYIILITYEKVNEVIPMDKINLNKAKILEIKIKNNFEKFDFSTTKQNIFSNDQIRSMAIKRKEMDDFFKSDDEKFTLDQYIVLIKNEPIDKTITMSNDFLALAKLTATQ